MSGNNNLENILEQNTTQQTKEYPDGIYCGELSSAGLRVGKGVMRYTKGGEEYSGDWVDDKMEGEGVLKWADGDVFVGRFKNGESSVGIFNFATGEVCDGEWKSFKPHGKGVLKLTSGECYEGEFVDGNYHGQGELQLCFKSKSRHSVFLPTIFICGEYQLKPVCCLCMSTLNCIVYVVVTPH